MAEVLVLDVVSLTRDMLAQDAPFIAQLARDGFVADLEPALPAVTTTAQASMLTGRPPRDHGIVGNGWFFRDLAEVLLWRQSNRLVTAPKVWEVARERGRDLTVAKLFWWYNMYSTATWSVTPRPHYTCDGRKFPGVYTQPAALEQELESELGTFPLFQFWGPEAGLASTQWIVEAGIRMLTRYRPDLALVYLPHLDYDFQRYGPDSKAARRAVRDLDGEVRRIVEAARGRGYEVLIVTEYPIRPVQGAVAVNRLLREGGFLGLRESLGRELLDCGASRAFAVADHQVAHVYVQDERDIPAVAELLRAQPGIGHVLDEEGKRAQGLDHARSGELVALAEPDRWFSYPWWLSDERAPDFARTVDIHRKPGYDPLELFYRSGLRFPRLRAMGKLLRRRLGFRTTFDLIGFDTARIRGSHGLASSPGSPPVVVGSVADHGRDRFTATDIFDLVLRFLGTNG